MEQLQTYVQQLRDDYRDLAPSEADHLRGPLTPVEAARMIAKNHPAVITGCTPLNPSGAHLDWALAATYSDLCKDPVTIAITDDGLADSVRQGANGNATFVKPLEEKMPMEQFLRRLRDPTEEEVLYLQSQDGNLFRSSERAGGEELADFRQHLQRDIPWMQAAIGCPAEAVNLWIGNSRAKTSIHHDPYENIYHVLSGSKTFLLLAPIEGLWLDQRFYPQSTLQRTSTGLLPVLDPPPTSDIPWVASHEIPPDVHFLEVTIKEGETLYLPNGWWHAVSQSEGRGGLAVAINYWYPAEIRPETYAYERLARRIARLGGMDGVIAPPGDSEDD